MKVYILSSGQKDLDEGYYFYEQQGEGLGDYFEESLFSDIESLKIFGGIHRIVMGYHMCISKRFPYAIYYKKDGERINVFAVLDCRRDPKWIQQRLK